MSDAPPKDLSGLPDDLRTTKLKMLALIRSEGRSINRFNLPSPAIKSEIEDIMCTTLDAVVDAHIRTKDATSSNNHAITQRAMPFKAMQQALAQDPTVKAYLEENAQEAGNVLVTLSGTVARHARELLKPYGITVVLDTNSFETLTGAKRPNSRKLYQPKDHPRQ